MQRVYVNRPLGSVRIVKNCDLGLENASLGLRPRAAFSRPRSQFIPIRTSQPANNIYLLLCVGSLKKNLYVGTFWARTSKLKSFTGSPHRDRTYLKDSYAQNVGCKKLVVFTLRDERMKSGRRILPPFGNS